MADEAIVPATGGDVPASPADDVIDTGVDVSELAERVDDVVDDVLEEKLDQIEQNEAERELMKEEVAFVHANAADEIEMVQQDSTMTEEEKQKEIEEIVSDMKEDHADIKEDFLENEREIIAATVGKASIKTEGSVKVFGAQATMDAASKALDAETGVEAATQTTKAAGLFACCLVQSSLKGAVVVADSALMTVSMPARITSDMLRTQVDSASEEDKMKALEKQYAFDPTKGDKPGNLAFRSLVYQAKLSIAAYLGKDKDYGAWPDRWKLSWMEIGDGKNDHADGEGGLATTLDKMHLNLSEAFDTKRGIQGFVARSKNFESKGGDVIISFRGTDQPKDWITNLNGAKTPFEPLVDDKSAGCCAACQGRGWAVCCCGSVQDVRAHLGYYSAILELREVWEKHVFEVIDIAISEGIPVRLVITGHSMGGALSTLMVGWCLQYFMTPDPTGLGGLPENLKIESITFGAPKAGNHKYYKWLMELPPVALDVGGCSIYRVFTQNDPIPCTPPLSLGFKHCYQTALLGDDGKLFIGDLDIGEKLKGKNKTMGSFKQALLQLIDDPLNFAKHHDIWYYYEKLSLFASEAEWAELASAFDKDTYDEFVQSDNFLHEF